MDGGGFDTSDRGTADACWREALEALPEVPFPCAPLLIVAPHPDDETFGCGGLIHSCNEQGLPVTVVLVTNGEKARPELPDLVARRFEELRAALGHLAPDARIVRLGLPDGGVPACSSELEAALEHLATPGVLLAVPYELDGHCDHDATGRAGLAVARKLELACIRYPIWAWHRLRPEQLLPAKLVRCALSPAASKAKHLAMAAHVSQLEDRPGGAIVPAHVLPYFQRPYEVYLQ